jgi:FixJ family two-component response regulator
MMIAIVDDEQSVRKALTRLLRSAGLDAETFDSGMEFLKSIDAQRPDCVVLDLQMPHMHGLAVQQHLAKIHVSIPVIILTAHDTPEDRERAMNGGASAYLRKPVDDGVLLDAISAAITRAKGAARQRQN